MSDISEKPESEAAMSPTLPKSSDQRSSLDKAQRRMQRTWWQQPLFLLGVVILSVWLVLAITAPWIAPYGVFDQIHPRYIPPSADAWFGSDEVGRDVFTRVIYGARLSIPFGVMLVVLSALIGAFLGGISGYVGGWTDELIMRFTDMVMSFPTIILALAVAAVLGPGLLNAAIAISLVSWPPFARVVRSYILSLREQDFVSAGRLLGASTRRVLIRDIVPNVGGPLTVLVMLEMGTAILLLAGLSFLGLGAQPPSAEWGRMVADGAAVLDRWWVGSFAGIAILSVVLALNLIGDTLRDVVDPKFD